VRDELAGKFGQPIASLGHSVRLLSSRRGYPLAAVAEFISVLAQSEM